MSRLVKGLGRFTGDGFVQEKHTMEMYTLFIGSLPTVTGWAVLV